MTCQFTLSRDYLGAFVRAVEAQSLCEGAYLLLVLASGVHWHVMEIKTFALSILQAACRSRCGEHPK